jgi:FkbM family methyltransferase
VSWVERLTKSAVERVGLHLRRRTNVPFGVYWESDARYLMGRRSRPTLVDVGANIGQTVQRMVHRFPDATIYSFEPVPATFAVLQHNTAKFAGVECINVALGDAPGEATITTDRGSRDTITLGVSSNLKTTVPVNTLDLFSAERAIDRIDLLKIEVEGFETSVLRGSAGMLSAGRVDFVLAACDFVRRRDEPHGDFFEIHEFLAPHGFLVVGLYNNGVDGRGWVWGDLLMMRQGCADHMPVTYSPFAR